MAALWNPRTLLGVDPDGPFTCVGTTKKGTRCRNSFISNLDLAEASNLLDRMAISDPWDARAHLSCLAEITLCARWHRKPGYSQVESMKHKWWNIIVSNYPEARPTRSMTSTTSSLEPVRRNSRQALYSTASTSSSRRLLTPPPSPLPAFRQRPLNSTAPVVRRIIPITLPTSTTPLRSPTDSLARSRASSNVSALSASSSVIVEVSDTPLASRTPLRSPTPDRNDIISSSASSSAAIPAALVTPPHSPVLSPVRSRNGGNTTTSPAIPCHHSSRRKPLTDECPIYNEEMHCLDDAVWCRAQCGTNMHRACFAQWRIECLNRDDTATCVYCREQWKYEWED